MGNLGYKIILALMVTMILQGGCIENGADIQPEDNDSKLNHQDTTNNDRIPGEEFIYGNATVQEIEILILESFPVQVNVITKGYLPDGCTGIDRITKNRAGNTFYITITTKRPAGAMCTQAILPFEEVITLDVAGLKAGVYNVDVNGVTGSFELAVDNILPDST